jgi:hypothetical protein
MLYCLIWDSPNLEGQVPVFISPRNKVAQLYPWALGSLYVVSYDSPLTTRRATVEVFQPSPYLEGLVPVYIAFRNRMVQSKVKSVSKSRYDWRPVNQYVPVPSPLDIEVVPSEKFQFDIRRCTLRLNCWCYHWEGCMRSMQCNAEFGYQLSICSGTKENHGKPWSSWPVAGPSGCRLTSSQQSGIKYASPNTSPYLRFFSFPPPLLFSLKTFTSCFYKNCICI